MCREVADADYVVSSLLQVVIDPFARTSEGFCHLIDKEWVLMGYFLNFYFCLTVLGLRK